ncbi:MAG: hypothetical protein IT454_04845 [Planctomycetes bacterium]|nr:hypothetical protein [Planctomycetota bacterium]
MNDDLPRDPALEKPASSSLRKLDAEQIARTAERLRQRVRERFPEANLGRVAVELESVACATAREIADLGRPIYWVRVPAMLVIAAALGLIASSIAALAPQATLFESVSDLVQGLEAVINELIFFGLFIAFLVTLETRIKRKRALKSIHTLRSLAHIVDMHQLTKDPERVAQPRADTPSSPERVLSPFELVRYLDYCSEMLALISKLAALHAQSLADEVVLAAVAEVESMAHGLSRNIWQKIMIVDRGQLETPRR